METLTLDERERVVDSALKIQSVQNSLSHVSADKLSDRVKITACLKSVDQNLRAALGYVRRLRPEGKAERRKNHTAQPKHDGLSAAPKAPVVPKPETVKEE